MGTKGIVASTAGPGDPAQRGDRRHDPGLADAGARRRRASARWRSRSRSCSRWACARSCRRSRRARAAAGPPPRSSRRWPSEIQGYLRDQMPAWRETHPGVEEMRVAVMGCVVNGPGESKHADIGISPAGHVRGAGRAGLRRRQARPDAARRRPRRRVHATSSRTTSTGATRPGTPRASFAALTGRRGCPARYAVGRS